MARLPVTKWLICLLLCGPVYARALEQYAIDLIGSDGDTVYLGLVNPSTETLALSMTGYQADGSAMSTYHLSLAPWGRYESEVTELFGDDIAWTTVSSGAPPVGYVRYVDQIGATRATVPLSRTSGGELWLPQAGMLDDTISPTTILVNTSDSEGFAEVDPRFESVSKKRATETGVEGFSRARQRASLDYSSMFAKPETILWDRLTATGMEVTGVQHLRHVNGGRAALNLPRTPYRRMLAGTLLPTRGGNWNKLVLINTNTLSLRVTITPHYEWFGSGNQSVTYDNAPIVYILEAGERREFDLAQPINQDIPATAAWLEIIPNESGLLGYQLFGNRDGSLLGAIEAGTHPSSRVALPYTPTDDDTITDIAIFNTAAEGNTAYVDGFNDKGERIAWYIPSRLRPNERRNITTREAFGDLAEQVTWVRVASSLGHLDAHSVIRRVAGDGLAGFQGVPVRALAQHAFVADAERLKVMELYGHGWERRVYTEAGRWRYAANFESRFGDFVKPGEFYIDHAFDAATGYSYLGYEPFNTDNYMSVAYGNPERVAMVSPYIEIPQFGTWYLNYDMRFHNPYDATEDSRYGMMWRIEGEEQWHWFGLRGKLLLNPPQDVADCYVEIQWRNLEVMVSGWLPVGMQLPAETAGKRIQIAYFYDQVPTQPNGVGPWMFLDNIRIDPNPLTHRIFDEEVGSDTFTEEELAQ